MSTDLSRQKRKKKDTEALNSAFMRIPGFAVPGARALLDLGFRAPYELAGRCPEHLYTLAAAKADDLDPLLAAYLRLAVYYAENADNEIDTHKLNVSAWVKH